MKVKLLKKIRKRFKWYKSSKGIWVVIDTHKGTANTVDEEMVAILYPKFPKDQINDDVLYNVLQSIITEPYINHYLQRIRYNKATRIYQRKNKHNG